MDKAGNTFKITENVIWVGVKVPDLKMVDAMFPLHDGTSYNSYLVIGSEKKALIDTVGPGFEKDLEDKIREFTDPADIDYIIMNHAEADDAGALEHMININKKAKIVTTILGAKMAHTFYKVPQERIMIVKEGDKIDLGGKTLRFIDAPMLHWPETMFTYLEEEQIIFTCDFFGAHTSTGNFESDHRSLHHEAKKYFGEIMMPYKLMGQNALNKLKTLKIRIIAPSHGPVYRDTHEIMESYAKWCSGTTEKKTTIIYASMWKSTEKLANDMGKRLRECGVHVALYNLADFDVGEMLADLLDSRAIVLGTPTFNAAPHPLALYAASVIENLKPPAKFAVILNSYGWSSTTVDQIKKYFDAAKIEVIGSMKENGPPSENDEKQIIALADVLAERING